MLVLSRKQSEAILIDNDIRIVLVGVRGTQVRIGIEAPDSVKVFREELCTEASPPPPPGEGSEGSSAAVACLGGYGGRRNPERLTTSKVRLKVQGRARSCRLAK